MHTGPIKVGQRFEWCPYGSDGWPHAWQAIEVTRIKYGDDDGFTETDQAGEEALIESRGRRGQLAWNEESRFREAVKAV